MTQQALQLELQVDHRRRAWSRVALHTAAVASLYCLVVIGILIAVLLRDWRDNPLTADRIAELKAQLATQPDSEQIKQQIREIDLQVRKTYFQHRAFVRHGGFLLLGGVIVFAIAAQLAGKLVETPYVPGPIPYSRAHPALVARAARWMTVGFACTTAAVFILLGLLPQHRLPSFAEAPNPVPAANAGPDQPASASEPLAPRQHYEANWPMFRGPYGTGNIAQGEYPTDWDGASGRNVLWKAAIDLPGNNSPIVWDNLVFCSAASESNREIYCFDASSGALKWKQPLPVGGKVELMEDTGFAASTMATDGRRVFAIFPDGALFALDFSGKIAWTKSLGIPKNQYGHASSLLVFEDKLIVQYDQGDSPKKEQAAVLAFDTLSGRQLWSTKRAVKNSWTSPILAMTSSGPQIITAAEPWIAAYDPASGAEIWRAKGNIGDVAPSPAYANDIAYLAQDRGDLFAFRTDGKGDVTATHKLPWDITDYLPEFVSPVCDGELVFMVKESGTVTCIDARTGEQVWQQELEVENHASPIVVGKLVYLIDTKGQMFIFEAAREYKLVARPNLGEEVNATPAFVGGRIYIRGKRHLYCIGK